MPEDTGALDVRSAGLVLRPLVSAVRTQGVRCGHRGMACKLARREAGTQETTHVEHIFQIRIEAVTRRDCSKAFLRIGTVRAQSYRLQARGVCAFVLCVCPSPGF